MNEACAGDLQIAGLVPFSTVDWPGHLAATVFCQGCPWQCTYCHNTALIACTQPGMVPWEHVESTLRRRVGLLDAVVFTGGEATRQYRPLAKAMESARALGFAIGLHTAGAYPHALRQLLPIMDGGWVGLDLKALPDHYQQVVGRAHAGQKAWECLGVIQEYVAGGGQIDYEVRTTVLPGDITFHDAFDVAHECRTRGVRSFAIQQARPMGVREGVTVSSPGFTQQCQALARRIEALGFENFTFRPAE